VNVIKSHCTWNYFCRWQLSIRSAREDILSLQLSPVPRSIAMAKSRRRTSAINSNSKSTYALFTCCTILSWDMIIGRTWGRIGGSRREICVSVGGFRTRMRKVTATRRHNTMTQRGVREGNESLWHFLLRVTRLRIFCLAARPRRISR